MLVILSPDSRGRHTITATEAAFDLGTAPLLMVVPCHQARAVLWVHM